MHPGALQRRRIALYSHDTQGLGHTRRNILVAAVLRVVDKVARDVLDAPTVARREWVADRSTETVRDVYDEVWVYGDPGVYDMVTEYSLPRSVSRKSDYTGYLAGSRPACLQIRYRGHLRVTPSSAEPGRERSAAAGCLVRGPTPRRASGPRPVD